LNRRLRAWFGQFPKRPQSVRLRGPASRCRRFQSRSVGANLYVTGKTGAGKTTFLETLISEDLSRSRGLAVASPERDIFPERLLPLVPTERLSDLVYFAPGDSRSPLVSGSSTGAKTWTSGLKNAAGPRPPTRGPSSGAWCMK